jgi:hypothetical protein
MSLAPFALTAFDVIPDRPFTCPTCNQHDLAVMERMAEVLRDTVEREKPMQRENRLDIFYLKENDGRPHRVVISNWNGLVVTETLVVVGFFGQRRPDADPIQTHIADAVLLQEFTHHPDLLSYSSIQLPDGNWGNLVLFRSVQGPYGWGHSKYHAQAAQEISPQYYYSIRLHNGEVTDGLFSGTPIRLNCTKYYDFTVQPLWKAVRTL